MGGGRGVWIIRGWVVPKNISVLTLRRAAARHAVYRACTHRGFKFKNITFDGRISGTRRDADGNGDARRPVIPLRLTVELEVEILYRYRAAGDGLRLCVDGFRKRSTAARQRVDNMITFGVAEVERLACPRPNRRGGWRKHAPAVGVGTVGIIAGHRLSIANGVAEKISRANRARHLLERKTHVALRRDER